MGAALAGLSTPAAADKGVQIWGFSNASGTELKFEWNNGDQKVTAAPGQMMGGKSCWGNITGTLDKYFEIHVDQSSALVELVAKIDPTFGDAVMTGFSPSSGQVMGNIWPTTYNSQNNPSQVSQSPAGNAGQVQINYGMYSAYKKDSTPIAGHDQAYAYVTPPMGTWMGDLRNASQSAWDAATLKDVVLPGAHDAGMWTLAPPINSGSQILSFLTTLEGLLHFVPGFPIVAKTVEEGAFNAAQNFALTQKDSPTKAMQHGIRYFDYRPAQVLGGLPGFDDADYYHVHNFVPGYSFNSFLNDVGNFLTDSGNEHEIIIVNVKDSGILGTSSSDPSKTGDIFVPLYADSADLSSAQTWITNVLGNQFPDLSPLFIEDFEAVSSKSLGALYNANNRLIFYFGTGYNDSYPQSKSQQEATYGTFDPSNVISALNTALPTCQTDTSNYTVFQLQDTVTDYLASNIGSTHDEIQQALISDNGSALLSTKGMFDNQTYPWALQNLSSCTTMAVMLNDFAGNLLAYNAKTLTNARINGGSVNVPQQGSCSSAKLKQ
ncbi:MAG: hypothetical protein AAF441_12940 [Pseudomonadota bacterium]